MKASIIFITLFVLTSVVNYQSDFSFNDQFGNLIIVNNIESLPNEITKSFLKEELTSRYFVLEDEDISNQYKIRINEFKKQGVNEYSIKALVEPLTRHNFGENDYILNFQNFKLTTKRTKGKTKLEKVEFIGIDK